MATDTNQNMMTATVHRDGARRWTSARAARTGGVFAFLAFFLLVGAAVSLWWIGKLDGPGAVFDRFGAVLAALGLTVTVTLANVSLRWIRWHFLIRSVDVRLTTKDSVLIYLVTLPAVLTPFYIGELLRVPLVGRKQPQHRGDIVYIWMLERFSDLLMLTAFATIRGRFRIHAILVTVLWVLAIAIMRFRFREKRLESWPGLWQIAVVLSSSVLAWSLVGVALSGILRLMQSPLSFVTALSTFGRTTVLGAVTGIPVGIGLAGSLLVRQLTTEAVPLAAAIVSTVVFRLGTVWFVVAIGFITAQLQWKRLLGRLQSQRPEDHFEEIAETYEHRIPEHVRQRLLMRKVRYMREALPTPAAPPRGLDVGCGHGWYACEMAQAGYEMVGVDRSESQVRMARRYADARNISCEFQHADGAKLPFEDHSFDFAYAINVLHHVTDPGAQRHVFEEIVRVLKPGGVFFLQEINTMNPLFRFYLGYVFPLIRGIDEGNERWIRPDELPDLADARWMKDKLYLTFLPDFVPGFLLKPLSPLERYLERSPLRKGSAHYVARLMKANPRRRSRERVPRHADVENM